MMPGFQQVRASIALILSDRLPYGRAAFQECLAAALAQDHVPPEVIVVDDRGPSATSFRRPSLARRSFVIYPAIT